ncbi:MerR family transcriptional regulator [Streptomyces sp. Ru73]|uniref:MerR family transcriptional regulator n=1 Tax=Streptomyces sp. Ru73 TaxID=2080748 RepID=UPI000CDE4460|nr:MerR family transcriptional regulator [Streptomyces sp. Ru73]POX38519.1 MerR family transcriptional regulator [Streptomyces sp. Ru73]
MRIGELAAATGTTPRALRHYEQEGLIGSTREANGYRDYDERAAVRVRNIRYLLDTGLTLADVRCFAGCLDGDMTTAPPSPEGLAVARDRLARIDARLAAQTEARNRLAQALEAATPPPPRAPLTPPAHPRPPAESRP